jgi:hypothetical protein
MSECGHIYTVGPFVGKSAVTNGQCFICGTPATLQPFEKMQPGEIDKVFKASCPKCDRRVWMFTHKSENFSGDLTVVDPDCRVCNWCGYVHWLRGQNESEVIPLQTAAGPAKKDRVRALVFAMVPAMSPSWDPVAVVAFAAAIDREIEATK